VHLLNRNLTAPFDIKKPKNLAVDKVGRKLVDVTLSFVRRAHELVFGGGDFLSILIIVCVFAVIRGDT